MNEVKKLPTLADLVDPSATDFKENALTVLLNQPPPEKWLEGHPMISGYRYLPIARVEYLLTRIFNKWWIEVKDVQVIANSVSVTVRLSVINPITKHVDYQEGVGAAAIQTDKGAGAMDWNKAKTTGVQMALPMAKSYALKDAAEQFGKLFGKDVSRKQQIDYDSLLKADPDKADPMEERVLIMLEACNSVEDLGLLEQDAKSEIGDVLPAHIVEKFNKKLLQLKGIA